MIAFLQAQSVEQLNPDIMNLQQLSEEELTGLATLLDNPVNLNKASGSELWFLSDSLADAILSARKSGPFRDWSDVARRTGLPKATIATLEQLATLTAAQRLDAHLSTRVVSNGSDERLRTRLRVDGGAWGAQWVVQRDPGEYQLADLSALSLTLHRGDDQFALGSQRLTWGLGLVLADEFAAPRGATLLRPVSRLVRLRPGYSNSNIGMLQGASADVRWERLRLVAGVSAQQPDITPGEDGAPRVVAHRTHHAPATTTGETLRYLGVISALLGWRAGGLATRYRLQPTPATTELNVDITSVVVQRSFKTGAGEWWAAHETGWRVTQAGKRNSVGETAHQTRLTYSATAGPGYRRLRLALMHRRYPPNWVPLRGRMVGRRASRGNEAGWYFGWQWRKKPWQVNGYLDLYRELQAAAADLWPRDGREWSLQGRGRWPRTTVTIYVRQRQEAGTVRLVNSSGVGTVQQQVQFTQYVSLIWSTDWARNWHSQLLAKGTLGRASTERQGGGSVGGRLRYTFPADHSITLGVYGFSTDSWDQRITVYEAGLPGEFNLTALYGRGVRLHGRLRIVVGCRSDLSAGRPGVAPG